jgi:hypothetical protein
MICFFESVATLKSFEKPKNPNWDDCGFAHLGTEPVPASALHQTGGG